MTVEQRDEFAAIVEKQLNNAHKIDRKDTITNKSK
jgi:hypothetical protein